MVTLFALLFLVGLIAMIVGFIKPVLFNKINPTNSRLKILVGGVVINMLLLAMVGVFAPKAEKKEVTTKSETTKQETKGEPEVQNVAEVKTENVEVEPKYKILSDESNSNITRKVNVELAERISKQQLQKIANEIKNSTKQDYERTFIMYRIQGEKSIAAWATTHFDPDLEIKLIGLDADNYKTLINKERYIDGKIIGQWYANSGFAEHIVVIYKKDGQYFEKAFYNHDDGSDDPEPKKLDFKQGKYSYANSDENWYFKINGNGDLEYWGENGNSTTANKF